MTSVRAAAFACALLAGCGGGLANERADPQPREDEEIEARAWHDRVVRLQSEARLANERGEPCEHLCEIVARACALTEQICELSARDDGDEGTRMLCEDARPRCASSTSEAGARCPECSA